MRPTPPAALFSGGGVVPNPKHSATFPGPTSAGRFIVSYGEVDTLQSARPCNKLSCDFPARQLPSTFFGSGFSLRTK